MEENKKSEIVRLKFRSDVFVFLAGPFFLLCAFALGSKPPVFIDLLCVGLLGAGICAYFRMKGFLYSLFLLGCVGLISHFMMDRLHSWRFGLESAFAISFFLTALGAEEQIRDKQSFVAKLDASQSACQNIEEELSQQQKEHLSQQTALQEKLNLLQKDLEEAILEKNSFDILNDVLRKETAKIRDAKADAQAMCLDAECKIQELFVEIDRVRQENELLKQDPLVKENKQLLSELNQIRLEKEGLWTSYQRQTLLYQEEKQALEHAFSQELNKQKESLADRSRLQQLQQDYERVSHLLSKTQEELQKSQEQALLSSQQLSALDSQRVHHLETEVQSLIQFRGLYQQLKDQFKEKNQILHETRKQLFNTETELQTYLWQDKERNLESPEWLTECVHLQEQLEAKEKEALLLEELVGALVKVPSDSLPISSKIRKKKILAEDEITLF